MTFLPINVNFNNQTIGQKADNTSSFNTDFNITSSIFKLDPMFTTPMMSSSLFQNMPSLNNFSCLFNLDKIFTTPISLGSFGTNVRSNVTLTSSSVQNALRLAESEIGTAEVGNSNNSFGVNKYRGGVANGQAWCASFVSWCYGQGQNSNNAKTFGYTSSSQDIKNKAIKAGYYSDKNSGYTPQVGDIAVWTKSDNAHGHVGIISKINNDGSFEVIEGNSSNRVKKNIRTRNSQDFAGFVRMNEWLAA